MAKFQLLHGATILGDLEFSNGKYKFQLSKDISLEQWNRIHGLFPLKDKNEIQSDTFFDSLNIRFPIQLRKADNNTKLEYIRDKKLKVISDSYELHSVK
ncbi:hypothetical protein KBC86_03205 [Candidatus Gracilibacteria bacterium]|nr:hypothetical protein [Candidatus Gracilibacteria bacterium]